MNNKKHLCMLSGCDQAKAVWKSEVNFAVMYKTKFRTFMDLFEAILGTGSVFHVA